MSILALKSGMSRARRDFDREQEADRAFSVPLREVECCRKLRKGENQSHFSDSPGNGERKEESAYLITSALQMFLKLLRVSLIVMKKGGWYLTR